MILGNFEQFWKNYFFHPRKCQNTFDVDQICLDILCMANTMHSAADKMRSAADTMHGAANTMRGAANVMHVRCGG